jgi:hypothetical protein
LPAYHQFSNIRPQKKEDIESFLKSKKIKRFSQYSHKISNFDDWEKNKMEFYDVTDKFEYSEPFYISTKLEPL